MSIRPVSSSGQSYGKIIPSSFERSLAAFGVELIAAGLNQRVTIAANDRFAHVEVLAPAGCAERVIALFVKLRMRPAANNTWRDSEGITYALICDSKPQPTPCR